MDSFSFWAAHLLDDRLDHPVVVAAYCVEEPIQEGWSYGVAGGAQKPVGILKFQGHTDLPAFSLAPNYHNPWELFLHHALGISTANANSCTRRPVAMGEGEHSSLNPLGHHAKPFPGESINRGTGTYGACRLAQAARDPLMEEAVVEAAMLVVMSGEVPLNVQVAGRGPPLIFIHGWAASMRFWQFQVPHFSRRYRVVTYDLRGHGSSGKPPRDCYSVSHHVGDLECIVGELGLSMPILVGHSLGGMIAMEYAVAHPRDVQALVLVGASPRPAFNWRERSKMVMFEWIIRFSRRLASRLTRRTLFSLGRDPKIVEWVRRESLRTPTKVLLACLRAAREFDVMDRLGELQMPTALVVGENDRTIPPQLLDYMVRAIPKATRLNLTGAGHNCMLDNPGLFNHMVGGFIEKLLPT